jgi:hypothetical protein
MSEYIKLGEETLLVDLDWSDKEGKNKRQNLSEIKKEAKENSLLFGYCAEIKNGVSQYVLFPSKEDRVVLGAAVISDVFKDAVFIKKAETEELDEIAYWVCAVDNDGLILEDGDRIFTDEEELELFVNDMIDLYEMKVAALKTESDDIHFDIDIKIEDDFFKNHFKDPKYKIKQLVREDSLNRKYVISGVFGLSLLVGGFIYNYEDPEYTAIVNEEFQSEMSAAGKKLRNYKKDLKTKVKYPIYKQEEFSLLGKKKFTDYYNSHFFDNDQIVNNFLYLDQTLDRYAMEWELKKIIFKNNKFRLVYERLNRSIGVFTDLDEYMMDFAKKDPVFDLDIEGDLLNSGSIRVYSVDFGKNRNEEIYRARLLEEQNRKSKMSVISDIEKNIKRIDEEMYTITEEVRELNLLQRVFTNSVMDSYLELDELVSEARSIYKEINKEIDKEIPLPTLKEGSYSGSELMYVEISQRDHLFAWSYPSKNLLFPEEARAKGNRAALKKEEVKFNKTGKKSKKKIDNLEFFAQSYLVQTASIEDVSNDSLYMQEALKFLDKPYIRIKTVEFEKETNQWAITSELFEGIKDVEDKKEDSNKKVNKK